MGKATVIKLPSPHSGERRGAPQPEQTALVALGGLLTVKRYYPLYSRILRLDKSSPLSAHERFVPPPEKGLGTVDGMRKEMNERINRLHDKLDRPLDLVGHSLGALMAIMATLDNPDIVASTTLLGGAHQGIKQETVGTRALRHAVGNPPEAQHLQHDSGFMRELHERVEEEWRPDTPVRIYSTMFDELIPPPQGFTMRPGGKAPQEMGLVVPNVPGIGTLVRLTLGEMPEGVELLRTNAFIEHCNLPISTAVLGRIAAHRFGEADIAPAISDDVTTVLPLIAAEAL